MNPTSRVQNDRAGRAMGAAWAAALWGLFALMLAMSHAARADDDLPGRVGRIADVGGQLYLSPEDRATEWAPVGQNYPVMSGDNLWVEGDGRAEIDYGGGQFRLAGGTSLHVARLADLELALFVAQGRLTLHVRTLDPGESVRIDTPATQVRFNRAGLYRVDVGADTQALTLTVREGEATIWLAGMAQQVRPGQTISMTNPAIAEIRNAVGVDGFDAWSADRDRYYDRAASMAYVSPQMVGASELDRYGEWATYPDYGPVWFPTAVAPDWAPYSDGYWTNGGGWGAVWVDAAPWGYAPSHYGRWAHVRGRWGWCPGTFVARPFWAPALVAWYGGPAWNYSARSAGPTYGWVALGWGEPYIPAWRNCGGRCLTAYNRPYAVVAPDRPQTKPLRYANAVVPGAVTVVSGAALAGAAPVAINRLRLPPEVVANAPSLAAAPQVKPLAPVAASRAVTLPMPASAVRVATKQAPAGAGSSASARTGPYAIPATNRPPGGASNPNPASQPSVRVPVAATPGPTDGGRVAGAPPARVGAPPAQTPDAGGRIVAAPPARMDANPYAPRAAGTLAPVPITATAQPDGAVAVPHTPVAPVHRNERNAQGPTLPAPGYVAPAPRYVTPTPVQEGTAVPVARPPVAQPMPAGGMAPPVARPPQYVAPPPMPSAAPVQAPQYAVMPGAAPHGVAPGGGPQSGASSGNQAGGGGPGGAPGAGPVR